MTAVIGLPVMLDGQRYNCAAVVCGGRLRGIVPKTHIPNDHEFNEKRWFASGAELKISSVQAREFGLTDAYAVPVTPGQIFDVKEDICNRNGRYRRFRAVGEGEVSVTVTIE